MKNIEDALRQILESIGENNVSFARVHGRIDALMDRVKFLEKIVFSAIGVVMLTVIGAIVALVITK